MLPLPRSAAGSLSIYRGRSPLLPRVSGREIVVSNSKRRSSGNLSSLSFWRKWALWAPTNRIPLVWEKSSYRKWLKTALEKSSKYWNFARKWSWRNECFHFRANLHAFDLHTFLRLTPDALSIAGGWRKCNTLLIFCQTIVQKRPSLFEKETWGSSELIFRGTLRKRLEVGELAESRVNVALGTGPLSQSFSHLHCLTLRSEWHGDRSLATRRCWGRHVQQRLGSLHVRRYIFDPLSVSLDTLRARHLLAAGTVHVATHRSAKKRSTTIAPNFPFARPWRRCFLALTLSATSSTTQVYTALAPSGITITRSSGVAIARSKSHRDRSLRVDRDRSLRLGVASQSLAVLDFRRLHGSNPHDFSSLKLHLGMGEDFSVKHQSELQKKLWAADHRFFAFDAEVNGRMTWGRTLKRNR